jgi:glycosyltransferase involved in cell wall biosynthesis
VVAFQTDATKDFVEHNTSGWLVPLGDEFALARAISLLSKSPEVMQRLGQQARRVVKNYYDLERSVSFYERFYDAVRRKEPISELADMSESMWPRHDPFSN